MHGVFLYHAGHFPPKAHCTKGNLSGGFVARSNYFVVDLPKCSMVVMCYGSKKRKAFWLAEGEGRIVWDHIAGNTQPRSNMVHSPVMTNCCSKPLWVARQMVYGQVIHDAVTAWQISTGWSKVTINVCILQGSVSARKSSKLMVHVKVEEYLSDNL